MSIFKSKINVYGVVNAATGTELEGDIPSRDLARQVKRDLEFTYVDRAKIVKATYVLQSEEYIR